MRGLWRRDFASQTAGHAGSRAVHRLPAKGGTTAAGDGCAAWRNRNFPGAIVIDLAELLFRGLSALAAGIAVWCALYVARRAARWRESDEAKALTLRLGVVENELFGLRVRLEGMPTKADFEGVKSDLRAVSRELDKVDGGVTRIEQYLLERGAK